MVELEEMDWQGAKTRVEDLIRVHVLELALNRQLLEFIEGKLKDGNKNIKAKKENR